MCQKWAKFLKSSKNLVRKRKTAKNIGKICKKIKILESVHKFDSKTFDLKNLFPPWKGVHPL